MNARVPTCFCILAELYDKYATKTLIFHSKPERVLITPPLTPKGSENKRLGVS